MTHFTNSPYAGRWVARVRGRIVAQGETPEQALRAAQQSRPKEKPEIIYMLPFPPLIKKVLDALPPEQEIYLVGGAVRDVLLARDSSDFDFAIPAQGIILARKIANALSADFIPLDEERDTGRVIYTDENNARIFLDFAVYRGADLIADLRGRDFTINAIAYDLRNGKIIDPTEGEKDLTAKLIRACAPTSLSEDPVRILRGIRLAAAFDFHIDINTRELMKQSADQLGHISAERLRDETFKMLKGPKPHACMQALEMLGVFPYLMPELSVMKDTEQTAPHVFNVWKHTLHVLEHLEQILTILIHAEPTDNAFLAALDSQIGKYQEKIAAHFEAALNVDRSHRSLVFFTALYHDVSKPETKTVEDTGRIRFFDHDIKGAEVAAERARQFNLSAAEAERIHAIIKNHMRMHFFADRLKKEKQTPSRKAIYRFFRDSDAAGIDLILLGLADLRATYAHTLTIEVWNSYLEVAQILLENYFERRDEIISPPRLIDGKILMKELGIMPGPIVGQLLESIRENQAEGNIKTREQALAFAQEELGKIA